MLSKLKDLNFSIRTVNFQSIGIGIIERHYYEEGLIKNYL
jgi:hypothetical protein